MSTEVTEAATPEQWADHFSRALDETESADLLTAALQLHLKAAKDADVQDACVAGLDLLRRWREAAQAIRMDEPFRADILLHDYRPIRPYARSIGTQLGRLLNREVSRG